MNVIELVKHIIYNDHLKESLSSLVNQGCAIIIKGCPCAVPNYPAPTGIQYDQKEMFVIIGLVDIDLENLQGY